MTKHRRKKAPYTTAKRAMRKFERDTLNLEYLRFVRDLAKEEICGLTKPLSVYSSAYFPITHQFREGLNKEGRLEALYQRYPMPKWNDLTIQLKVSLFQLLCEEENNSLYAFHPKIHPELLKELEGKNLVSIMNKRVRRRLNKLGAYPQRHFFVVEARKKNGEEVAPHIHGLAMVEEEGQAQALKEAIGQAAGQNSGGRSKLPSGNRGEYCYHSSGKSFPNYILKNKDADGLKFGRKSFVFSRPANQMTRSFYEFITGQI